MLIKVRYGVFETNSSSVHTLSIPLTRGAINPEETKKWYGNGKPLKIQFGEFGWGPDVLRSLEDKLSYIATSMQYYLRLDDVLDNLPGKLQIIYGSNYYKWLKEVILQYTTWTDLLFEPLHGNWDPFGYVDHQSTDTLNDLFAADEQRFKDIAATILFNDRCVIVILNDNC